MNNSTHKKHKLIKRLLPLYLAAFFNGLIFWYAIEKLFMTKIGFDTQSITYAAAISTIATLIFETPLGVLADR